MCFFGRRVFFFFGREGGRERGVGGRGGEEVVISLGEGRERGRRRERRGWDRERGGPFFFFG